MTGSIIRKTSDKIRIFRNLFSGLSNVYGTYNPNTDRASQVKAPVTNRVLLDHLTGQKPYGVYLLVNDRIRAIAVDFDTKDQLPPMEFVNQAKHYSLTAYIERSKSKGHHVWMFFNSQGVLAAKARLVVRHILDEIEQPDTEVFPKQDALDTNIRYGNFINAPLFAPLVPKGNTVFVHPATFKQYSDQWGFLESVKRVPESVLDDIVELNDLSPAVTYQAIRPTCGNKKTNAFSLPPCAQKMLQNGVSRFQRVSCFRLAVNLKRLGLPYDVVVAVLKVWALKNRPKDGKQVIKEHEIVDQASCAFKRNYRGYGCNSEAVAPFCQAECPINRLKEGSIPEISEP